MPRIASNKCRGRILRSVWNLWPLAERWHLGIYYEQRCWEPSTTLTLQGWRRGRAPVNRTAGCLLMKEAGNILQYEQRCWELVVRTVPRQLRMGTSPVIMLTAWWIWKHRNAAVFDNAWPSVTSLFNDIVVEARQWADASPRCGLATPLD
jgi:hypothetical protein